MARVAAGVAVASSLGFATALPWQKTDPPIGGTPTVYVTVTEQGRYQGKTARWWRNRAVRRTRERDKAVLAQQSSARTVKRQTLLLRQRFASGLHGLVDAFLCVHRYEGSWRADTGNGYHGGLQMDRTFMGQYGAWAIRRWGDAENWPPEVQIVVALTAYYSGRGFYPWPKTARMCGLL